MNYTTTIELETALAKFFNYRQNIIVPNISWGMHLHECDMLILSKAGYATEVEIKVSLSDLKKDREKSHTHTSTYIKRLYFAMPEKLCGKDVAQYIPERAGIIAVTTRGKCHIIRQCKYNIRAQKFSDDMRYQMARLGTMRIWSLKRKIIILKKSA